MRFFVFSEIPASMLLETQKVKFSKYSGSRIPADIFIVLAIKILPDKETFVALFL